MKKSLFAVLSVLAMATVGRAESTVKLTGVHLCCKSCVNGVNKAVNTVQGVTAACEAEAETVTLTAPDAPSAQKAVDAMVAAGYFGKSADAAVQLKDTSGAKDAKVTTLTVNDVHLCCGKCVTAVNKAIGKVNGVTGNTAEKNAKSFEVTGNFNARDLFHALQAAGLTGKAGN